MREGWPWRERLYAQGSSGSLTARTGNLFKGESYLKGKPAEKRKEGWQVKEYFSIGELAELFGLNIQTLYYYDSVGIFSPRERNEKNGRRKYEFDQIYELATVSYMRRLGYSLEEIKESRTSLNSSRAVDIMKQRSQKLRRQWQKLLNIDHSPVVLLRGCLQGRGLRRL